ncbi:MAG: HlyC/CorC family transporter [Gammaproteobacteria bacterium]|nr:HlyC/CorC family transporter [Gammaproteobacteria bacterium]
MEDIPLSVLFSALGLLLILSAFFSSSETGLMSLNRYRLRHLVKNKHRGAMRANKLLETPDRLIGLILLGNNFVNILASSIATIIALKIGGEAAIAIGAGILTLVILIFSEVAPKTVAARYPEKIAFPAALVYIPLLKILYPLVWIINAISNGLIKVLGVNLDQAGADEDLSPDELKTVLNEAGTLIPKRHKNMLLSILDLEKVTVEDIMIPRNDVTGIDLNDDWNDIIELLIHGHHTRIPVYHDDINKIVGIIHVRSIMRTLAQKELTPEGLMESIKEPYFVPEATPLNTQLLNFQRNEQRIALVVDEYGDIQGLVTLEDILEEIVGEFTSDPSTTLKDVHPKKDGSFLVDGSANIRELNKTMHWELPFDGPKTFSGLITEHLENIPATNISVKIAGYPIEIIQTQGNKVKIARILPALRSKSEKKLENY